MQIGLLSDTYLHNRNIVHIIFEFRNVIIDINH